MFEKSYEKLTHAIVKPMVSYFIPLMILLLFLITICALVGHFMFGFYSSSEHDTDVIRNWYNLPQAFMSVLDTFLGDQWADAYDVQKHRPANDRKSRRIILALFFMTSVLGLGVIYAAVFIAVLIFKVG